MARALGSPDDAGKAQAALKANQGKITHNMYLVSMANCLFDASQAYSARELNDSEKEKILMDRALEVIKPLPESFETKDLGVRIRLAQPTT
jgi:hypothetical protein